MTPETRDALRPFHDEAIARGIPEDDVERWLGTARPCLALAQCGADGDDGGGPVVGRFGGPLLLPADVPDPAHPFVASIDLAALPADASGLPLPPDGHLLFFAFPELRSSYESEGSVVYVPAGTAVTERDRNAWNSLDFDDEAAMFEAFPQGPLRALPGVSLPYHHSVDIPEEPWSEPLPGHPRAEELAEVWEDTHDAIAPASSFRIGGYACDEGVYTDPIGIAALRAGQAAEAGRGDGPVSGDVSDWVLLADWYAGMDVQGWESATVHWAIQREDLAAWRFHRVFTSVFWNP
ncbi:DUF1963 domain-containing protein [Streptomyces sp. NPDC059096]|uniref:DUF1963 domain-containing protein n=1 Tax=Streptomyces sp. NPDC059096 TaxID=3346727 RepID=UPI0036CD3626